VVYAKERYHTSDMQHKKGIKPRFSLKALYRAGKKAAFPFDLEDSTPVPRPEGDDLFEWMKFYLYKEVLGIESKHTARAKGYDLQKLLVYFDVSFGHQKIERWDKAFTASFVAALEKEYEISSVYRTFATVTNFVNFLILYEVIKPIEKPTEGVRLRDQELPPPQGVQLVAEGKQKAFYLSSQEIYDLMMGAAKSFIEKQDPKDRKDRTMPHRDAAIFALLYNSGLRVEELCSITISQMDRIPDGGIWLRNVKCKGKKVRKAYVKEEAVTVLLNYIETERGEEPGVIFRSWRKNRLNQPDIWRILKKLASKAQENLPAGVIIDIHPHSLRHERGFNLKKAGLGDATVAEQLGHRGTGHVARYSRRTEEDEAEMLKDV